ncbi:MAG: hypothetical protein H6877_08650 [Rhodobiaceae bacterium]|nr:hypothetical protein [Rhodobiaceae bacterium]
MSASTRSASSPNSPMTSKCERSVDFIVVDTPGNDSYLMRLVYSMADTLVTPINDRLRRFRCPGRCRSGEPLKFRASAISRVWCVKQAQAPYRRRGADRLGCGAQPYRHA